MAENVADGISGIRTTMKKIQQTIKTKNENAERDEKQVETVKQRYFRSYGQQQSIRDRYTTTEEKLEKTEEKLKDVQKRVNEKEKFLEESKQFNKSLKHVSADEAMVAEVEERLNNLKDIYSKNYERYQVARSKKIQLDQDVEMSELKAHESMRRVKTLQTEFEYNTIEEARRTQGCKDAIDAAFKSEKSCLDLQSGLDTIMKRKSIATQKINKMEKEVTTKENAIETLKFERKRMEHTIREMLINLKSQVQV